MRRIVRRSRSAYFRDCHNVGTLFSTWLHRLASVVTRRDRRTRRGGRTDGRMRENSSSHFDAPLAASAPPPLFGVLLGGRVEVDMPARRRPGPNIPTRLAAGRKHTKMISCPWTGWMRERRFNWQSGRYVYLAVSFMRRRVNLKSCKNM